MYKVYLCKLCLLHTPALSLFLYMCNEEGFSASQPYIFRCEFETSTSTFTKEYGFTLNPNIAKRHPKKQTTHINAEY